MEAQEKKLGSRAAVARVAVKSRSRLSEKLDGSVSKRVKAPRVSSGIDKSDRKMKKRIN
tara:strand:- start:410 stop:586 length:177 start_codon:yes stop_codon:yes gene_type:complete